MADSTDCDTFPTDEEVLGIIDAVRAELPAHLLSDGWLQDFRNRLREVFRTGVYSSLGMLDHGEEARQKHRQLRERLANKSGISANDPRLRRLPDSHIREFVDAAGWFFQDWWDRPFAATRTHGSVREAPRADGPAVRFLRAASMALADAIEGGRLPSSWLAKESSPDTSIAIVTRLRALSIGGEAARDAIRASTPYKIHKEIEAQLKARIAEVSPQDSAETGGSAALPLG